MMIAEALVDGFPGANALLLTGVLESAAFPRRKGVDMVSLPSLFKLENDHYLSRWLDVDVRQLISIRSRIITSALEAFEPDLFIVDNVPRGAMGELDGSLAYLRSRTSCKVVLGLRDILDHPDVVEKEWRDAGNFDVIRSLYDEVWIYGDPNVFDATVAYRFPTDVQTRVSFTGYLSRHGRSVGVHTNGRSSDRPLVLCTVGGGQDGYPVARAVSKAHYPKHAEAVILAGPYMAEHSYRKLVKHARTRSDLRVERFRSSPSELFDRAGRIVSMGGYNTVIELLGLGRRPLIVPRVAPRLEQAIRAIRLQEVGLVDILLPEDLSRKSISRWLRNKPALVDMARSIDLAGVESVARNLKRLVGFGEASAA
ncbi:MAG TPA: glycosyl transferase family 28 [Rhodothermia bacterium]|nr:glycosyl transferase family 28 [Rhodothermia bacterium]